MASSGIISYAGYVPHYRLERAAIGGALGSSGGRGARSVASYDEDTTTMAVEAARRALGTTPPTDVFFATTDPAYADKTNATAIHAALGLSSHGFAADIVGSTRGGIAAMRSAGARGGLAVMSDIRTGLPGSADERDGGDGAAAFVFGMGDDVIAEVIAEASNTTEFIDRWREPGSRASRTWEDRFGAFEYEPIVRDVVSRCLEAAGLETVEHLVLSSPHARTVRTVARGLPGEMVPGARELIGYAGAADVGLGLAAALDRAKPGETILVVSAADGADALLIRVTDAIAAHPLASALQDDPGGTQPVAYNDFLTWRGMLRRDPPRRPEPDRVAGPPSARSQPWKFAFVGSLCTNCGWIHLPPNRVCANCREAVMEPVPLAGVPAVVTTFTVDHLAFSLAPPIIDVVLDFEKGGRFICSTADCTPEQVDIGQRMEMTFRRLGTSDGIHNYFWKARPIMATLKSRES